MPKWALLIGAILVGLGLSGYFGTAAGPTSEPLAQGTTGLTRDEAAGSASSEVDAATQPKKRSATALIPAAFGVLLLLCGTLGLDGRMRKHAMHAAAGVATLGILASGARLATGLGQLFSGDISRAQYFLIGMFICCAVFLFLAVQSFRNARATRLTGEKG